MNDDRRRSASARGGTPTPPETTATRGPSTEDETFAEAVRQYVAGRRTDAERLCETALIANPDHAGSLHLLGVIAHQSGRLDRAVELLTRAAALSERESAVHNHLGKALAETGRMEVARIHFERALALAPDDTETLYNLANALAALQEIDPAIAAFEKALALKPDYADARLNLGSLLARLDRPSEAIGQFEAVIAVQPDSAEAYNNLGFVLNGRGRHHQAIAALERALAIAPDYPEALNNLGNARLATGAVTEAIACYQAALSLRPEYVNAFGNLGNALFQSGRYEEAREQFERARALDPHSPAINSGLGNTLQKLGRWNDAVACYERAVALKPDYADAWTNLAAAYNDQRLHDKALACCDKAIAVDGRRAEAFNNRGIALVALDRFDEAMASYARALAINPNLATAYVNIGSALVERGRIDEAIGQFDRAIAIEPRQPQFHLCHVLTKRVVDGDPRLAALEALARDASAMPGEARVDLHFALAKAYSDVGRRAEAFAELLSGNALKRKRVDYDEAATLGRLERIARAWPREVVEAWRGPGHPSARPVFILGMPRSGSTLVEQILACHPAVRAGGEISAFQDSATAALGTIEDYVPAREPADRRAARLGRIADLYLAALDSVAPDTQLVTDKMPANFALIGLIRLAFPNARIIHTRRNALDTCLSCFSTLFTAVPYSYDLGELGRYYRAYERLMAHWRGVLPESAILDVDYEMLVSDFEAEARRIVAYCGLPWDPACLSFYTSRQPIKTASAVQVRQPLYRTSIGRWRGIDLDLLRPLRAALGKEDYSAP